MSSTMGMSRNRTQQFNKYREAARAHARPLAMDLDPADRSTSTTRLLDGGGGASTSHSSIDMPPGWVDVSKGVSDDIAKIKAKLVELAKCHARALLTTFGDAAEESQVEVLTMMITGLFRQAEKKLKELSAWRDRGDTSAEDAKMVTNAQRSLAGELQTLSLDFRRQQKGFLQKIQKQQEGGSLLGGIDLEGGGGGDEYDPGFTDQQMATLQGVEGSAQERDKEIQSIVESVNSLAEMMKDLSVLVIDQGSILDRIDYNVQEVSMAVEKGLVELKKADKTQKKSRMVMCIMLLIVAVVFMVLVLAVKSII